MSQNQNNNSGCLIPWADGFLPNFMFFFHRNQDDPEIPYLKMKMEKVRRIQMIDQLLASAIEISPHGRTYAAMDCRYNNGSGND